MTNVFTAEVILIEKEPSVAVVVPPVLPLGVMLAPAIGEPSFESVILPVTTRSCAHNDNGITNRKIATIPTSNRVLVIYNDLKFWCVFHTQSNLFPELPKKMYLKIVNSLYLIRIKWRRGHRRSIIK
jgi:hypothetical protein